MRASIIIAAHNEGNLVRRTVESVKHTLGSLEAEIVVVDDASTDDSVKELQYRHPDIQVHAITERGGVSRTKDCGARTAKGDVLVFLDGHCKPEAGAVERLVEDVELSAGQAILTPRICALDEETWQNRDDLVGHGYGVRLDTLEASWRELDQLIPTKLSDGRIVYETPTFIGCVVAMSRRLYVRLHGFDTGMMSWGSEDVDLGVQSWLLGHPVYHDPEPLIGHRFQSTFGKYVVPNGHALANQLRMARRTFSDEVWKVWLPWFQQQQPSDYWNESWRVFRVRQHSVERERRYLFAHRVRDEFWYSHQFQLSWPVNDGSQRRAATAHQRFGPLSQGLPNEQPGQDPSQRPSPPPSISPAPTTGPGPSSSPSPGSPTPPPPSPSPWPAAPTPAPPETPGQDPDPRPTQEPSPAPPAPSSSPLPPSSPPG